MSSTVLKKVQDMQDQLCGAFVERNAEVSCVILGMIAQEHVWLCGPPGTAKSLLLRNACDSIDGAEVFEYLMMKDTDRSELLGFIDMEAVQKHQKWQRMMANQLPTAHFVFLDEFPRASSFAANILLRAMNERELIDMGKKIEIPLRTAVVGGNDWPIGEGFQEWHAIFDRFLIRKTVKHVSHIGRARLAFDTLPEKMAKIATLADIDQAAAEAAVLPVSDETKEVFMTILQKLENDGIKVGDRRIRKSVKVCRAAAWLDGADEVGVTHLEPLVDILWEDPNEHAKKAHGIIMPLANPVGHEISSLFVEIDDVLKNGFKDLPSAATALKKLESSKKKASELAKKSDKRGKELVEYIDKQRLALASKLTSGVL